MSDWKKQYLRANNQRIKGTKRGEDKEGRRYHSQAEAAFADQLLLEERAGLIKNIRRQVNLQLMPGIKMIVDFEVFHMELNEDIFLEVKGFSTEVWLLKLAVYRQMGTKRYRIFKRDYRSGRFAMTEEVIPKGYVHG